MNRLAEHWGPRTRSDPPDIGRLRQRLRGHVVLPRDPDYEAARKVWNGMVDRNPAIIAYCAGADDVVEAIRFARSHDLPASVRSGGHDIAGVSVCDHGLVIDLSRMKGIVVDPSRRTARAGPGLLLGEFDAATQAFGLATTMGVNSETGIAGLTLGGGFGRLGRRHGLTCDNLLAAEVATADGALLRAIATENPDLFWGVRGGGGNFGIATSFEYRLHPVGPTVLAGELVYDHRHMAEALRFYHAFSSSAPDEVSADAVLATLPSGAPVLTVSVCYTGPLDVGARVLEPLRAYGAPIADRIAPVAYVATQAALDGVFPRGHRYYWKAQFLRDLPDPAIDTLLSWCVTAPSTSSRAVLRQVGGAIARVPPGETAYGNRDVAYDCCPIAIWQDPVDDEANVQWVCDFWAEMQRFSTGGVCANHLGDEGAHRVRAAYGANYRRLAELKKRYDPTNLFRFNQNVPPAA